MGKGQQRGVQFNNGDGVSGALYGSFPGLPWRDKFKDATEIRVWFHGIIVKEYSQVDSIEIRKWERSEGASD